jgi:sulfate adenylyltransferase
LLNKVSHFNLINAANVKSGLFQDQIVTTADGLCKFQNKIYGLPILIPADELVFDFCELDIFELNPLEVCKIVYGHEDLSYVGFRHAYPNKRFLSKFQIKPKFQETFDNIVQQNLDCCLMVRETRKKWGTIGSFQTRNIPHSGHEEIIRKMLEHCDHVVINPVTGPKKTGDVKISALEHVFTNLAQRKYKNRISFLPIIANMYYAGPREALHHALLRQKIGFDLFSVGRDHAGAGGVYNPNAAIQLINKYSDELQISVMCHNGASFCEKCEQVVLIGECNCEDKNLVDISGTHFRNAIRSNEIYAFADHEMQKDLFDVDFEVFEN